MVYVIMAAKYTAPLGTMEAQTKPTMEAVAKYLSDECGFDDPDDFVDANPDLYIAISAVH